MNPGVLGTQGFNTPLEISWSVVKEEKDTKVHVVEFAGVLARWLLVNMG